ncbi:arginine kinase-like [Drosophila guanche]|uniref:arginine kinase n=1 Tax=Drosophila guanche TaxID=7266 RepID=A0A3B0JTB6_DROGU|nr:arginine kinase-like [Drosophila guanche]SPP85367.1 blast:Arginine kinase [Drosophila guanche]
MLRLQALRPGTFLFLCRQASKGGKPIDSDTLLRLEDGYKELVASDSKSLLKKHLKKDLFEKLKKKTTASFNSSLLDCIQTGLSNHDSAVGIVAPEPEAYKTFAEIFDPIIEDFHKGFKKTDKHPECCFGKCNDFANLDPDNKYILSTRVRCGRSVKNFPFISCLSENAFAKLEAMISGALNTMSGSYKGSYLPLSGIEKSVQQKLIDEHFLFRDCDRFLKTSGAKRFWPAARGIYFNEARNFVVWVNEEDHLRIISMEKGGDIGKVYERMIGGVEALEKHLDFSRDERLGYLTFCPTNLGSTIRASVHIKLPNLSDNPKEFWKLMDKYNLQRRGTRGEHTKVEDGVYDISNKRRVGLTEYEAVKEMYDGIRALIDAENKIFK